MKEKNNAINGKIMHIIPYTHGDYAWTHTRQWHVERGSLIINEALELMEKYHDLTYCIDNYNHVLEPFLQAYPDKKDEFLKRVQEGRIEITGGIISLVRPTQAGGEIFIRNIQLGREKFEKIFGELPINVYLNADVSIGHRQIPQLMKLSNIKYYRGWRPQGAMDYNNIPRAFWYEGIDGTRIITTRGSYVGFNRVSYLNDIDSDYSLTAETFFKNELQDILSKNNTQNVWISHGMDDTRLLRDFDDTEVDIYSFVKRWNEEESGVLKFSTPTEYFKTLESEELPVVAKTLDCCDVAYNAPCKGENGMWRKRQMLERLLCSAESFCAIAASFGFEYPKAIFDEMWEGLVILAAHGLEFLLKEDSDKCVYLAQKINAQALELIENSKAYIIDKLNVKEKSIVLFNSDAKPKKEKVCLDLSFPTGSSAFEIFDLNGNCLPYQTEYILQGDVPYCGTFFDCARVVVEAEVPALGYTSLYVKNINPKDAITPFNINSETIHWGLKGAICEVINNGIYNITFERGEITKIEQDNIVLYEKSNDNSYLCDLSFVSVKEQKQNCWLFFNNVVGLDSFKTESWEFEEFGPQRWVLCTKGKIGDTHAIKKTTVYSNTKRIDFQIDLLIPEAVQGYYKAAFPIADTPNFVGAIPFGTEEKDIEKIVYGKVTDNPTDNLERMCEGFFFSKDFVNYTSPNNSQQAILANTVGGYYVYDKYNHTVANILTRNLKVTTTSNWEQFTDNLVVGKHNFKLSFLPSANVVDTIKEHKKICTPLQMGTKFSRFGVGEIPPSYSLCEIKTENVILSAFSFEGNKFILRAYEAAGNDTLFVAEFGKKVLSARAIDFFGNTVADVSVEEKRVTAPLGHNGIINLEIEFE